MLSSENMKKYVAECLGTFVLVFFACGTAAAVGTAGTGYLITALAFGLVIVAMAYSIGNISGCHINPAVSLAMFLTHQLSLTDLCGYVIAQFIGATAGAALLIPFLPEGSTFGANGLISRIGLTSLSTGASIALSLLIEIILTCVFVFVILSVTAKKENGRISGMVIGFTLTLVHILGIAFTGTSVNPARSFGPALFAAILSDSSAMADYWVFLVAPLVGAALAALLYRCFAKKNADPPSVPAGEAGAAQENDTP